MICEMYTYRNRPSQNLTDSLKYYLPLVLLLHTSESESLISKESGAHSLAAHLAIAGGLLDAVTVCLLVLVVVSVVL